MEKKIEMVLDGVKLLAGIGVSVLVGGAVTLVKPAKLGAIKKIAVGVGGAALSGMLSDQAIDYVDQKGREIVETVKNLIQKPKVEETETEEAI